MDEKVIRAALRAARGTIAQRLGEPGLPRAFVGDEWIARATTSASATCARVLENVIADLGGPVTAGGPVAALGYNPQPDPSALLDWYLLDSKGNPLVRVIALRGTADDRTIRIRFRIERYTPERGGGHGTEGTPRDGSG